MKQSNTIIAKIEQGKPLPPICISCGEKSETFLFKKAIQPIEDYWYMKVFFTWSHLLFSDPDFRTKVNVQLPLCLACKQEHHSIQPKKVDYVGFSMEFEAHEKFKKALDKFRSGRYIRYNQFLKKK